MTIYEMDSVIQQYCIGRNCDDCAVGSICTSACGIFTDDESKCRKAYEIITAESEAKTHDNVNHPAHYETGKFECIDVMCEAIGTESVKDFCLCNAFKYLYRCNRKHDKPIEDIKKAVWYLNKYLELEGEKA